MKKRILSLLLTLVMALSLLPVSAFAEDSGAAGFTVKKIGIVEGGVQVASIHGFTKITDDGNNTYTVNVDANAAAGDQKLSITCDGTGPREDGAKLYAGLFGENDTKKTGYSFSEKKTTVSLPFPIFPDLGAATQCTLVVGYLNKQELRADGTKKDGKRIEDYDSAQKYTLTVRRAAALSDLAVTTEGFALTPAFSTTAAKQSYTVEMPDGKTSFDLKLTPVAADKTNIYVIDNDTNVKTLVGEKDNYTYTASIDKDELIKTFIIRGEFREGDGAAAEYTLTLKRPNAPDGATLLYTADDLVALRDRVNSGDACEGEHFKLAKDITLPEDWEPMGCLLELDADAKALGHKIGKYVYPFSGSIDGNNKTLTVPEGGKPLLGYVNGAEVKNLNIYGEKINGYGLVNDLHGVNLSGSAIVIDNVALKSGSSTLKSGLIGAEIDKRFNSYAGASAGFTVTVRNCTIEKDVVVGYDGTQSEIGSIAGRMQGTVENCVSYATVKGVHYVGGIIGTKDNALGDCTVNNCTFGGTVEASGNNAGGIVGGGYNDSSAPNGIHVGVKNCAVTKDVAVSGKENVGGILGGDEIVAQAWNSYAITDNTFLGKVKGEKNVGGIIGYYRSLNKFDNISNNIYAADCGATKGIGAVEFVDTNQYANLMKKDGATYFNTSKMEVSKEDPYTLYLYAEDGKLVKGPYVAGCWWKADHNRTDDPLGKDAVKLCRSTNESLLPDDNGAGTPGATTPATGDTGVTVWVIALPTAVLAAAFVLKRKEREA